MLCGLSVYIYIKIYAGGERVQKMNLEAWTGAWEGEARREVRSAPVVEETIPRQNPQNLVMAWVWAEEGGQRRC